MVHFFRSANASLLGTGLRQFTTKSLEKFDDTLNLPKTSFPIHCNTQKQEQKYLELATKVLYQWQKSARETSEGFVLHDGPPYANGALHIGHALNRILKDIINRYKLLRGYQIDYTPGWDCHGLPTELQAIKDLKASNAPIISPLIIREKSRAVATKSIEEQATSMKRWGVLADWENKYTTMDKEYEALQLLAFWDLYDQDYIYRDFKPVYWSPSSRSALAEAELEYEEKHISKAAYVQMAMLPNNFISEHSVRLLIWTTTPWTLTANKAVAVNPTMQYVLVKIHDACYIIANDRLNAVREILSWTNVEIISSFLGQQLEGLKYQNPADHQVYSIICSQHVIPDSGTGLVHMAPGHGMEDYNACRPYNISPISHVNDDGLFLPSAGDHLSGQRVLQEGTDSILSYIGNAVLHCESFSHKYPYDWRTKKPVLVRATRQWFIRIRSLTNSLADKSISALDQVKTIPPSGKRRLQNMLRQRDDWCISRQRCWGVPIPVFYNVETGEPIVSRDIVQHVASVFQSRGSDAWWRSSMKDLLPTAYHQDLESLVRGDDTMDVWLDSGLSWANLLAHRLSQDRHDHRSFNKHFFVHMKKQQQQQQQQQQHESAELKPAVLPEMLYVEGSDQHRGWFQSSLLTSVALSGAAPYKTLITHGFVLDDLGRKMSKSLGNVLQPAVVMDGGKYGNKVLNPLGVETLRLWASSTDYVSDVKIGPNVLEKVHDSLKKMRNTVRYLLANLYDFDRERDAVPVVTLRQIDQYMLHILFRYYEHVTSCYESFDFYKNFQESIKFCVSDLSSFYFDIIKDRLYADGMNSHSRRSAQFVLFQVLEVFYRAFGPVLPLTMEEAYDCSTHLKEKNPSVFMLPWKSLPSEWMNETLNAKITLVRSLKGELNSLMEAVRRDNTIGSSLALQINICSENVEFMDMLRSLSNELSEILLVSKITLGHVEMETLKEGSLSLASGSEVISCSVKIGSSEQFKCPRCWTFHSENENELCERCEESISKASVESF